MSLEIVEGDEEPEPGDGATKLGAHVLRVAAGLSGYIAARPAVVKFVGEWGSAANVPDGMLAIGRRHQGEYDAQLLTALLIGGGSQVIHKVVDKARDPYGNLDNPTFIRR